MLQVEKCRTFPKDVPFAGDRRRSRPDDIAGQAAKPFAKVSTHTKRSEAQEAIVGKHTGRKIRRGYGRASPIWNLGT